MPEKHPRSEVVMVTSAAATTTREAQMKVSPCGSLKANTPWTALPDHATTTTTINNNRSSNSTSNNNSNSSSSSSSSSNIKTSSNNNNNTSSSSSTTSSSRQAGATSRVVGVAGQVSRIAEGLYLSGARAVRPACIAELGVTCVVNATTELPNAPLAGVRVVAVRVADRPSADLLRHLGAAADLIQEEVSGGGRVLVHCVAGVSRSPALVLAFLVRHQGMPLRDAFLHVRALRPSARPNSGFFSQLIQFERAERGWSSVTLCATPGGRVPDVCVEEAAAMHDKRCVAALGDRRALQIAYA